MVELIDMKRKPDTDESAPAKVDSNKADSDSTMVPEKSISDFPRGGWPQLQGITDSQAAILAALITSLISLIVSFAVAYQGRQQSKELETIKANLAKEVEKTKHDLNEEDKLKEKLDGARREAYKSMQEMKDTLKDLTDDSAMPFSMAKGLLASASQKLVTSYRDNTAELVGKDPGQEQFRSKFHDAKNEGLQVLKELSRLQQSEAEPLSEEIKAILNESRSRISAIQDDVRKDTIKPTSMNNNNQ